MNAATALSRRTLSSRPAPARGVALFVVLIFMLVLTMLGLTAMRAATTGERMARNQVDKARAMQAAEAALRDAERDLRWIRFDDSYCKNAAGGVVAGCRTSGRPFPDQIALFGGATGNCVAGECYRAPPLAFDPPVWENKDMWATAVEYRTYTGAPALTNVSQQPKYLIERFDRGPTFYFRISALGYGADSNTRVVLQSIFKPN